MAKKSNKFSAFKLFYDEFIYKRDFNVGAISRNLDIIKSEVFKVRKTSKYNLDYYMLVLDRSNKRIKKQLNEIYMNNPNVFEFFYLLYKAKTNYSNNNIKDMPFVISCSFYEDYRLDDKTVEDLENNNPVIPKYSSIEKKQIRDDTSDKPKIVVLLDIIKNSKDSYRYKRELELLDNLFIDFRPSKSNYRNYFNRIKEKNRLNDHIFLRFLSKIKNSSLKEEIDDLFTIIYRKKFDYTIEELDKMIIEYFDSLYIKYNSEKDIFENYLISNDISYESYKTLINDYTKEKSTFKKIYESGEFEPLGIFDKSDINTFKITLINMYYDNRYINNFENLKSPLDYANRALELYGLADDLENQLFEKVLFNSSHSKSLGRYADVNSALLEKIYYLYNPFDLKNRYEKTRKDFELNISKKSANFIKEYTTELNEMKLKRDFHGPIPSKEVISIKLVEKQKEFLFEHCISDLINNNKTRSYDTRNYDLNVITEGLTIDDLISTYEKMKYRINSFDFSSLTIIDTNQKEEEYTKAEYLKHLQKFIAENIFNVLDYKDLTDDQKINRLKDICYSYLKEKCLFINASSTKKKSNVVFNDILKQYDLESKWKTLYSKYEIK